MTWFCPESKSSEKILSDEVEKLKRQITKLKKENDWLKSLITTLQDLLKDRDL